jgi:hypothetical protein
MAFEAPTLHYFDAYYPAFEKAVASFQLGSTSSKKTGSALSRQFVAESPTKTSSTAR